MYFCQKLVGVKLTHSFCSTSFLELSCETFPLHRESNPVDLPTESWQDRPGATRSATAQFELQRGTTGGMSAHKVLGKLEMVA